MSFEQEQSGLVQGSGHQGPTTQASLVSPLGRESAGTGWGGGYSEASPSPPPGRFAPDAQPTTGAVAARADVMSHYAEDLGGPPFDIHALLGDLEAKLPGDAHDKGQGLAALDELATAKKAEAHQQIEVQEAKFEQHAAQAKTEVHEQAKEQVQKVKEPAHPEGEHTLHGPGTKAKQPALQCGPVSKDSLKARVEETMQRELAELDKNYDKEQTKLTGKVANQLDQLSAEKKNQEGKVGAQLGHGVGDLQGDIAKRAGVHAQEIAKAQKDIDAEAATQNQGIHGQGKADQDRAVAAQKQQAALDVAHADAKAAEIRQQAPIEGGRALAVASGRGSEFVAAASARQKTVPGGESKQVGDTGQQRNVAALLVGQRQQQQILAKGESDAKAALDQGKRAAATMAAGGKPGATYSDQIAASTKAGTDRVDGAAKKAGQDMQAVSGQAVVNMQVAAGEAAHKSTDKAGAASTAMGAAEAEAQGVAEKEKATALAQMKSRYQSTKAQIEAKGKAELAKIDKTPDRELCNLERQVSGDLKAMGKMADQADVQMAAQVKLAERKVAAEVAKKKTAMRLSAQQAIAAISGFVAQARSKIKAADKGTLKDIKTQGQLGHKAVIETGKQALSDVTKGNDAIVKKVETDGVADRAAMDAQAKASEAAMAKTATDTKGAVDEQVLQDTLAITGKTIQKKAWYDWTSDKQANTALDALTSLPKDLQGRAIEKLPPDQFKNLLSEVPEKRREEFESLVEATTDPERKLQLWAGYAKSKAHNDADRLKGDTGHWYGRNKEQKENDRKNDARQNIAKTTDKEVDEEVAHLRELQKNGTPLTKEAVGELYERKKFENQIEMKYNVNLTNETGNSNAVSGPGADKSKTPQDRAVWSKDELQEVEKGLSRLPAEAVSDNDHLKAITRRGGDYSWDDTSKQWGDSGVRAWHTSEGQIIINDAAALNPHNAHPRFTDAAGRPIQSDLSGDPTRPGYDHANVYAPASSISGTLTHEIGHDIAQKHPELIAKITASSDWQEGATRVDASGHVVNQEAELKAHLQSQGLNAAQVAARIADMKKKHYEHENFGDRQYKYNNYTGKIESFSEGAIPADPGKAGAYDYMRTDPDEQFAELYSKIANAPTQSHADLVSDPAQRASRAQAALITAQQAAAANPGDAAAAQKVVDAQKSLTTAQSNQRALQTQWDVMRNEVYHTDDAQKQAAAGLTAHAGTPNAQQQAILNDFNARAAECGTPDQIEQLQRDYQSRLDAAKTP